MDIRKWLFCRKTETITEWGSNQSVQWIGETECCHLWHCYTKIVVQWATDMERVLLSVKYLIIFLQSNRVMLWQLNTFTAISGFQTMHYNFSYTEKIKYINNECKTNLWKTLFGTQLEEMFKKCRIYIISEINKLKMGWPDISGRAKGQTHKEDWRLRKTLEGSKRECKMILN
jgi:hypothetical protein